MNSTAVNYIWYIIDLIFLPISEFRSRWLHSLRPFKEAGGRRASQGIMVRWSWGATEGEIRQASVGTAVALCHYCPSAALEEKGRSCHMATLSWLPNDFHAMHCQEVLVAPNATDFFFFFEHIFKIRELYQNSLRTKSCKAEGRGGF